MKIQVWNIHVIYLDPWFDNNVNATGLHRGTDVFEHNIDFY